MVFFCVHGCVGGMVSLSVGYVDGMGGMGLRFVYCVACALFWENIFMLRTSAQTLIASVLRLPYIHYNCALCTLHPMDVQPLVSTLTSTTKRLSKAETRACRIIVSFIESTLKKTRNLIVACPEAPILCMYSSDGWSATVATSQHASIDPTYSS